MYTCICVHVYIPDGNVMWSSIIASNILQIYLCAHVYKSFIFIFVYNIRKCIFVHTYLCIGVKYCNMYVCVQYTYMYVCVCMCVDMSLCIVSSSNTIHKLHKCT